MKQPGNEVLETIDCGDKIWINTQEKLQSTAIYVERTPESRSVSPGDLVWWLGVKAFWTPRVESFRDRPMNRVGVVPASRPDQT